MDRVFGIVGALSAFIAVAAGAFGAHALRSRLSAEMLAVFETGARYQMYHALALLAVSWSMQRWGNSQFAWSGWLFIVGTVIFSGSLYVLSLTGMHWLGRITPLGGVSFLLGWLFLAWAFAAGR
jgi:uncharacterized membrane protein YgdD (TMEM256/DUF423 family)